MNFKEVKRQTIQEILAEAMRFGEAFKDVKTGSGAPYEDYCRVMEKAITKSIDHCAKSLWSLGIDWATVHYVTRHTPPAGRSAGQNIQVGAPTAEHMIRYCNQLRVYRSGRLSPYIRYFSAGVYEDAKPRQILFDKGPNRPESLDKDWYYLGGPLVKDFVDITEGNESQGDAAQAELETMRKHDPDSLCLLTSKLSEWSGQRGALSEPKAVGLFRDACRVTFLALKHTDIPLPRTAILCPIYVEGNLVGGTAFVGNTVMDPLAVAALNVFAYNLLSGLRLLEDDEREKQVAQMRVRNDMRDEVVQRLLHSIHNPIDSLASVIRDALAKMQIIEDLTERFKAIEEPLLTLQDAAHKLLVAFAREDVADLLVAKKSRLGLRDFLETLALMHSNLFKEKHIELTVESIPDAWVAFVDKRALWEVLANLLTNALRYAHKAVRISIEQNRDQNTFTIRVRDDGDGIDPIIRDRLFQPGATGTSGSGHGYGLYIAKIVMQKQGGDIHFNEKVTDGTEFVVDVPVSTETNEQDNQ